MSRPGFKDISIPVEDFKLIKIKAIQDGDNGYEAVKRAFKIAYNFDFPSDKCEIED